METVTIEAPGRLSLSAIPKLRRLVREREIDIVHSHGYKTDILGVLATRGTSCAVVSTPHGWSTDAGPKVQLYEALDRLSFAWCDRIAPLSEDLMTGLRRLPWAAQRARFIPNGVDLSEVTESNAVATELSQFRAAGGRAIGYIGQLISRKRIDTLIEALARLGDPRLRLYLVGEGVARQELQALSDKLGVAAQVRFVGFREDRLDYLRGFDLFVLASALEGIPRCLMESMAAGIPVIASDIEGTRTLVQTGQTGILFPLGSAVALSSAIRTLLDDEKMRTRMAREARKLVSEKFSAERMAQDYLGLFRELRPRVAAADSYRASMD
jgi:glycosyltransferase involved in cell wall biosynthesis